MSVNRHMETENLVAADQLADSRPNGDYITTTAVARFAEWDSRPRMIDAEIVVDTLAEDHARRLDKRIRLIVDSIESCLEKLGQLVAEAKEGNIHVALGFRSWTAYLADAINIEPRNRDERRELVAMLAGEGLSQRVIADVVGASKGTVQNDLLDRSCPVDQGKTEITGRNGKTYPVAAPRPKLDVSPRRRAPITDQANKAGWELRKAVERAQRVADDDRFTRQANAIGDQLRGHLAFAIDACQTLLDLLDASQKPPRNEGRAGGAA